MPSARARNSVPSAERDYREALSWLYRLEPRGIRLGLERMRRALQLRGSPEEAFRVVQVAGTNGKGSTAAMTANLLRVSGKRVGLYTSPHLHAFTERIQVDGRPLSRKQLLRRVRELQAFVDDETSPWLTFFEVSLLMACERFRDAGCDVAVLEVGLGGRLDATTAVGADVSVITEVDFDHRHRLGDTITAIAREKAGIIRAGVPVVIAASRPAARRVVGRRASRLGAPRLYAGRDFGWSASESMYFGDRTISRLRLGLAGDHQRGNAAAAAQAALCIDAKMGDAEVRRGLRTVRWPGRLEHVEGAPSYLFDAAHNPAGCARLADYLRATPHPGRRVLLFGAMADKELGPMLAALDGLVDSRVFVAPPMRRAAPARALAQVRKGRAAASIESAIRMVERSAGAGGQVIVAGSIFLLAEVRARVLGLECDPPIPL